MQGFKEQHLQSVCNNVLDFIDVTVTPTQVYEHIRKWKLWWAMVCKVKNVPGVSFCSESYTIMMDKEQIKSHLVVHFAYHFFVEHVHYVMMNSTNKIFSQS
jgi:hypothetical protein